MSDLNDRGVLCTGVRVGDGVKFTTSDGEIEVRLSRQNSGGHLRFFIIAPKNIHIDRLPREKKKVSDGSP